jgi:hypothetical protein
LLQAVVQQLQQLFPDVQPYIHPAVSSAIIVPGKGPLQPDYQQCGACIVCDALLLSAAVVALALVASSQPRILLM